VTTSQHLPRNRVAKKWHPPSSHGSARIG